MSDDWASRKVQSLKSALEERKRKEDLEYQRRTKVIAAAPRMCQLLIDNIKRSVSSFNELRKHEFFGSPEIGALEVGHASGQYIIKVVAPRAVLRVGLDEKMPAIPYSVSSVNSSFEEEATGELTFTLDGEEVWLQDGEGAKLSVPDAADRLLDMLV